MTRADPSGGGAPFRIERREVLEQRREEKKKLTAPVEHAGRELSVGTRSSCGLVLDDPIAAGRHCVLYLEAGRFLIKDGDNATGTYVNGVRIQEPTVVQGGDRVALGVTILELEQDPDQPARLIVGVREGAFFYTVKKRGQFESDADEWVRSEVRFGRTPRLVALNVATLVLGVGAAAWLLAGTAGRTALQPASLAAHHAALFSDAPPSDPRLAFMVDIARDQGCAACHEGQAETGAFSCGKCHVDVVAGAAERRVHPFEVGDSLQCATCHREHHGAVPPPGTLFPADPGGLCVDCHGAEFDDDAALRAGIAAAEASYGLPTTGGAPAARRVSQGFEAFGHGAHAAIECSECHLPSAAGSSLDFEVVDFERCMVCHAIDSEVTGTSRPGEEHRWGTTWHGAGVDGSNCTSCHAAAYEPEMATVARVRSAGATFDVTLRGHAEFHAAGAAPGDCATCHKSGAPLHSGDERLARPFRHDQHLSSIAPEGEAMRALVNGQCAECHADVAGSDALTSAPDVYVGPSVDACASCHSEGDVALITRAGTPLDPLATTAAVAFEHDLHGGVVGGCITCHEFSSEPAPGTGSPRPSTSDDVASCVRCHARQVESSVVAHAGIGGGDCDACHADRWAARPERPMAAVYYGPTPEQRRPTAFSHALEGHRGQSCQECHGDPAALGEVQLPTESSSSCRECHARNRFHWR